MMLWHGTSANNILEIVRNGLKITPLNASHHGSRYGKGIYFSDSFALSSCFSAESDEEKYILLCEVALGNMANILTINNTEIQENGWYDSIRAMPSMGPDWDGFVTKDEVVYPIGKRINYPQPVLTSYVSDAILNYDKKPTALQKYYADKIKANKGVRKSEAKQGYHVDEEQYSDEDELENDDFMDYNNRPKMGRKAKRGAKATAKNNQQVQFLLNY